MLGCCGMAAAEEAEKEGGRKRVRGWGCVLGLRDGCGWRRLRAKFGLIWLHHSDADSETLSRV